MTPVIAVVDQHGSLITLRRPDGAQVASVQLAQDKARTTAVLRNGSSVAQRADRLGAAARYIPPVNGVGFRAPFL